MRNFVQEVRALASHNWLWFYFWLAVKVAQVFLSQSRSVAKPSQMQMIFDIKQSKLFIYINMLLRPHSFLFLHYWQPASTACHLVMCWLLPSDRLFLRGLATVPRTFPTAIPILALFQVMLLFWYHIGECFRANVPVAIFFHYGVVVWIVYKDERNKTKL